MTLIICIFINYLLNIDGDHLDGLQKLLSVPFSEIIQKEEIQVGMFQSILFNKCCNYSAMK